MGCSSPLKICVSTPSMEKSLASVCSENGSDKSGLAKTGAWVNASFSFSKASCCSSVQCHRTSLLISFVNGALYSANRSINLEYQPIIPKNRRNCFRFTGAGYSSIGRTLFSSAFRPSSFTTYPKYFTSAQQNSDFFRLIWRFAFFNASRTASNHLMCFSKVGATMMTSSR